MGLFFGVGVKLKCMQDRKNNFHYSNRDQNADPYKSHTRYELYKRVFVGSINFYASLTVTRRGKSSSSIKIYIWRLSVGFQILLTKNLMT